jgi:hypothetical protein
VLQRAVFKTVAKSCFDLSSDHSSILITLTVDPLNQENEPVLNNRHTNWNDFKCFVSERLTLNIPLKTEEDIEAVQWAGWNAAPQHKSTLKAYDCPIIIEQKIEEKRRLCRDWHHLRTPTSNRLLNAATQQLKELHNKKNV